MTMQDAPHATSESITPHDLALRIQQAWDKKFSKPMDSGSRGLDYQMAVLAAETVLEAARPHLVAGGCTHADTMGAAREARLDERERIARLLDERGATWLEPCDADDQQHGLHTHHRRPAADLLRQEPGGTT